MAKDKGNKKKGSGLKLLLCIILALAALVVVANVIPPKKVTKSNPFLKSRDALPMIAAHRGGGVSNPENTLMAFRAAVNEYGVQICETDLWMTSDGHLVYSHDSSINRVACPEGADKVVIAEHTLAELRAYNMGYNFKDPDSGEYIYRGLSDAEQQAKGLKILEFHELLEEFYSTRKDLLFIVEIKDFGETGYAAADIIDKTLTERFPDYRNNVVVGTFHPEIEEDLQSDHPDLMRGASTSGAAKFILTQMLRLNLIARVDFTCLQIPMEYNIKGVRVDLARRTYVERAHRRNIAVQFWTINDADDMRFLIDLGVDAIMTDDPQLLKKVLDEYDKHSAEDLDYLVLVNKENKLPADWEGKIAVDTVKNSVGTYVETEKEAYGAYLKLKAELEKEGIIVDLDSARRSVEEQQRTWDAFMEKYGDTYTRRTVAVPGYSEHHTGLALDLYLIIDGKDIVENEDLVQYPEIWAKIHEKLAKYGFILRYLEGKEAITGYGYEPWHIRYVGSPDIAKEITDKGITLEEYLGVLPKGDVAPPPEN